MLVLFSAQLYFLCCFIFSFFLLILKIFLKQKHSGATGGPAKPVQPGFASFLRETLELKEFLVLHMTKEQSVLLRGPCL